MEDEPRRTEIPDLQEGEQNSTSLLRVANRTILYFPLCLSQLTFYHVYKTASLSTEECTDGVGQGQ